MEWLNSLKAPAHLSLTMGWPLEPGIWILLCAVYYHCATVVMQPLQQRLCCSLIQLSGRIFQSCQKGCLVKAAACQGSPSEQPFGTPAQDRVCWGHWRWLRVPPGPVTTAQLVQGIESTSLAEPSSLLTAAKLTSWQYKQNTEWKWLDLAVESVQDYLHLRAVTTDCCPVTHVLFRWHRATHKYLYGSILLLRETGLGWQENQNCTDI